MIGADGQYSELLRIIKSSIIKIIICTAIIAIVFKMQNMSGGANQDCIAAMPANEGWKCGFANVCKQYYS